MQDSARCLPEGSSILVHVAGIARLFLHFRYFGRQRILFCIFNDENFDAGSAITGVTAEGD
ncbi:MAG: hypothetical protein ACI9TB_001213 [Parasphingorhabdus sp.]|jgi:hypothetical protein